ncbi:alpha/beta fold hydrolase [Tenggerimyces flavus]|uniref:Alpha/beta fold hydrolase n=1 Tax=Tenggerimyces flavus TaxID=1708749 RepID=A0ABV7Y4Q8_9ACTN|nr:alpha/beta hydrolase [Tenggerimyces flavus]MBM7791270.1 pimeloyl-ACP methyl ester carboxylesterase [Tenggerimyces flavus]
MTTTTSRDGTKIAFSTTGNGPGLIVVGGALKTADDYRDLANALTSFTVHTVDRRGRGDSGPQGKDYDVRKEVEDLLAVQNATGARFVFGHSYGGFVALEAADAFDKVATYEPGLPSDPFPTTWMKPYEQALDRGDPRGALVHFVKGSGGAPRLIERMPDWYLRLMMRFVFPGEKWRRTVPLLRPCLAEHQQLAALQGETGRYADLTTPTLVLTGTKSRGDFQPLQDELKTATFETIEGLDHFGPEGKTAPRVAKTVSGFLLP